MEEASLQRLQGSSTYLHVLWEVVIESTWVSERAGDLKQA